MGILSLEALTKSHDLGNEQMMIPKWDGYEGKKVE